MAHKHQLKLYKYVNFTTEISGDWQKAQMLLGTNEASDITGCCAAAEGTLDSASKSELGVTTISECETTVCFHAQL
jgi:hypothetical protein